MSALEFNRRGIRNVECWCSEKEAVSLSIEFIIARLSKHNYKLIIIPIYQYLTSKCAYSKHYNLPNNNEIRVQEDIRP